MRNFQRQAVPQTPPPQKIKTTSARNHTPSPAFFNDRELREVGLVRSNDGTFLDNRDGFYDAYPNDYLKVYDSRTCVAVSHGLFYRLLEALIRETEHGGDA